MNPNESAFPHLHRTIPDSEQQFLEYGLSKREYFAAQIISGPAMRGTRKHDRARLAVEIADALVAELSKPKDFK